MTKSRRAFTLVELLVVVGIIAVLIAILMPVLSKVRRTAALLASPIAFRDPNGSLFVCRPGGGELSILPAKSVSPAAPVIWSPNGTWIGFWGFGTPGGPSAVNILVNPQTGRLYSHHSTLGHFSGWSDDGHYLTLIGGPILRVCEAGSGAVGEVFNGYSTDSAIRPVPPSTGWSYIATHGLTSPAGDSMQKVLFLKKDFSPGKVVWVEEVNTGVPLRPAVDPFGEFVAWTRQVGSGHTGLVAIAIKPVRSPSAQVPTMIGTDYARTVHFCDWTDDGNLLAAVDNGGYHTGDLVVFDRQGKLLKRIPTDTDVAMYDTGAASWRKYWHQ